MGGQRPVHACHVPVSSVERRFRAGGSSMGSSADDCMLRHPQQMRNWFQAAPAGGCEAAAAAAAVGSAAVCHGCRGILPAALQHCLRALGAPCGRLRGLSPHGGPIQHPPVRRCREAMRQLVFVPLLLPKLAGRLGSPVAAVARSQLRKLALYWPPPRSKHGPNKHELRCTCLSRSGFKAAARNPTWR